MSAPRGSNAIASEHGPRPAPMDRLRLYQRIHVRLTAIYGVALLFVLTPAAAFVYELAVESELAGLDARLRMTTITLASLIDADRVMAIDAPDAPYRVELKQRFDEVIAGEPEISSIFVFAPTD